MASKSGCPPGANMSLPGHWLSAHMRERFIFHRKACGLGQAQCVIDVYHYRFYHDNSLAEYVNCFTVYATQQTDLRSH